MSVYVRNLPSTISTLDIMQEFKSFGRMKQDGVFLRNRKVSLFHRVKVKLGGFKYVNNELGIDGQEVGVCYAFVEFEDIQSAKNAIKVCSI